MTPFSSELGKLLEAFKLQQYRYDGEKHRLEEELETFKFENVTLRAELLALETRSGQSKYIQELSFLKSKLFKQSKLNCRLSNELKEKSSKIVVLSESEQILQKKIDSLQTEYSTLNEILISASEERIKLQLENEKLQSQLTHIRRNQKRWGELEMGKLLGGLRQVQSDYFERFMNAKQMCEKDQEKKDEDGTSDADDEDDLKSSTAGLMTLRPEVTCCSTELEDGSETEARSLSFDGDVAKMFGAAGQEQKGLGNKYFKSSERKQESKEKAIVHFNRHGNGEWRPCSSDGTPYLY